MKLVSFFMAALLLPLGAAEVQEVSGMSGHEVAVPPAAVQPATPARNVILMIGDGMGSEHVWAAWACNGGRLNLMRLPVAGWSRTSSSSHAVTDSAAGGTAIACGERTANGVVGQSPKGRPYSSIAAELRAAGLATGLVVTKSITDATPAAFYAHASHRSQTPRIASQLAEAGFDVVLGGGAADVPAEAVERMREAGALVELAAPRDLPPATKRGDYLPQSVARALKALDGKGQGFFLMVEGSQIDLAAHANDLRETVAEVLDFDRAVGVALDWVAEHPDTLLVVTADHQTGGLSILNANVEGRSVKGHFSTRSHSGLAVPLYAAGAGAQHFGGIYDNRDIPGRVRAACDGAPAAGQAQTGR